MNSNENADRTASSSFRRMSALVSQVEAKWEGIQVGRQGSYSIERLESLEHYCKTTTTTHVVLVCLLTPLPALSAALLLETLPLRRASDGWAANWVFWIRLAFISFLLLTSGLLVMKRLVIGLSLTWGRILVIAAGVGASSTGFAILLAIVVGFPVPFVAVLGSLPDGLLIGAMLALIFGVAPFRRSSPLRPALAKFYTFLVAHQTLVTIYPLVKVLYGLVPAKYQGFTMLLLPLWKFAAKKYVGHSIHDMEDYGLAIYQVRYG